MEIIRQNVKPSKIQKRILINSENLRMEAALNKWFKKQRERNSPVTGDMLKHTVVVWHAK